MQIITLHYLIVHAHVIEILGYPRFNISIRNPNYPGIINKNNREPKA